MAPVAAASIRTLMSSDHSRSACHALRAVRGAPTAIATADSNGEIGETGLKYSAAHPAANARPANGRSEERHVHPGDPAEIGSSCSSQACIPASATASAIADEESLAAS